jgi:hypothetical protein
MQYHGQMAVQVGILVAFTQLIPEHQVQLFGIFRARVKVWLPVVLSTDGSDSSPRRFQWHISRFRS